MSLSSSAVMEDVEQSENVSNNLRSPRSSSKAGLLKRQISGILRRPIAAATPSKSTKRAREPDLDALDEEDSESDSKRQRVEAPVTPRIRKVASSSLIGSVNRTASAMLQRVAELRVHRVADDAASPRRSARALLKSASFPDRDDAPWLELAHFALPSLPFQAELSTLTSERDMDAARTDPAETNTDMNVETNTETNTEMNVETNTETNEMNVETNTETNVEAPEAIADDIAMCAEEKAASAECLEEGFESAQSAAPEGEAEMDLEDEEKNAMNLDDVPAEVAAPVPRVQIAPLFSRSGAQHDTNEDEANGESDSDDGWIREAPDTTPSLGAAPEVILYKLERNLYQFYARFFRGNEQQHFTAQSSKSRAAMLISVCVGADGTYVQIHTAQEVHRARAKNCGETISSKWIGEAVKQLTGHSCKHVRAHDGDRNELEECLLRLEQQEEPQQFKFGVLYVANGQTDENEMFQNVSSVPESGSEAYDEFLSLLGEKVRLKEWAYFAGGLDVSGDRTGAHSVFSRIAGCEVMFHVATLLPHDAADEQCLDKKRHLGNDIATILFVDRPLGSDFTYAPATIRSHFTHVLCAVTPAGKDQNGEDSYYVEFARKKCVPSFGPELPQLPTVVAAKSLRPYLLCKLINGETAAYSAPAFQDRLQKAKELFLKNIMPKSKEQ